METKEETTKNVAFYKPCLQCVQHVFKSLKHFKYDVSCFPERMYLLSAPPTSHLRLTSNVRTACCYCSI